RLSIVFFSMFLSYYHFFFFFFFYDPATTEIYTLSLHDALPISGCFYLLNADFFLPVERFVATGQTFLMTFLLPVCIYFFLKSLGDRKSTRLNSSHVKISYAVFCLKKKKNNTVL